MRFAVAATVAGLAAVSSASYAPGYGASNSSTSAYGLPDSYVTEVVTAYTTYCPEATQITHNGETYTITEATTLTITNCPYTITEATTLTITNCPCTVTKPVYTSVASSCETCSVAAPTYPASSSAAPPPYYPSSNGTTPTATGTGSYTPPAETSPIAPGYTGAANKVSFGVAGVLAAVGMVAAL